MISKEASFISIYLLLVNHLVPLRVSSNLKDIIDVVDEGLVSPRECLANRDEPKHQHQWHIECNDCIEG